MTCLVQSVKVHCKRGSDAVAIASDNQNVTFENNMPYSPELNPAEGLWQHINNKTTKNEIYESLRI